MSDFLPIGPEEWRRYLRLLDEADSSAEELTGLFVRLAKPYDLVRIREAAPAVSKYLAHSDPFVRHQALWFLCGWGNSFGKFPDHASAAFQVFQNDPDNTNRAYAARCLGGYYSLPAPDAIDVLVKTASDVNEDKEVRLSAYGALIMLLKGSAFKKEADRFLYNYIDGATPAEFDWDWLLVDQQQFLRMRP